MNTRTGRMLVLGVMAVLVTGCATTGVYAPAPAAEVGFLDRAKSQSEGGLTVTVAVPSPDEAHQLFGFKMGKKHIQPVWVEVINDSGRDQWFLSHSLDPDYYSALEVAWIGRSAYTKAARRDMEKAFHDAAMPFHVPVGETESGYVFVNEKLGNRRVLIELVSEDAEVASFEFMVEVPGLSTDYQQVDFEALYDSMTEVDESALREWIEAQPATVTNAKKTKTGDPLNIVVIGSDDAVWPAFVRAGWHVTETMSGGATWKTIKSSLFGKQYLYSPVSPLYVFDRPQDIALQKPRATVDERNHLRLWLAPITYEGSYVWLGQISRDIGVRLTTQSPTITTHKIDPDVDETRTYLIQDLLATQGVAAFALATGVGETLIDEPRGNLTGDPFFTDGLRVVLFMSETRVDIEEVEFLEWERP